MTAQDKPVVTVASYAASLITAGLTAVVLSSLIPGFWYESRLIKLLVIAVITVIFTVVYQDRLFGNKARPRTVEKPKRWMIYGLVFLFGSGLILLGLWWLGYDLPIPPRWHQLEVIYQVQDNPAGAEVVLLQLNVGSEIQPLAFFEQAAGWRQEARYDYPDSLWTREDGKLSYLFKAGAFEQLTLLFYTFPGAGVVRVHLDNQEQTVNLDEAAEGNRQITLGISSMPYWVAWMGVQAVVLACLGMVVVTLLGLITRTFFSKIGRSLSKAVNTWYEDTTPGFEKVVVATLVLSVLLTIFLFCEPFLTRHDYPQIQAAAGQQPSSVFVIITDALSAQDMSLYGYDLPTTPDLESMTQGWTIYNNAQTSQTCSSAMLPAVLTGRYPYTSVYQNYGRWTSSQEGWVNLSQFLVNSGYQTWWDGYLSPGVYQFGSGLTHFLGAPSKPLELLVRSRFKSDAITKAKGRAFIPWPLQQIVNIRFRGFGLGINRFIENYPAWRKDGILTQPYFIYYHFGGAHGPDYNGGPFTGSFLPLEDGMADSASHRAVYGKYDLALQPQADLLRLRYDEAVRRVDSQLGNFLTALQAEATYDSMMIIITADHGQNFYNGFSSHCTPLVSYGETHVPLLIKYPFQHEGKRVDTIVSTIDIAPTILDALGYTYPVDWFDGISLLSLEQEPDLQRVVLSRRMMPTTPGIPFITAMDDQFRFVMHGKTELVYDYRSDPAEQNNLLLAMQDDPRIQRLRQAILIYRERADQLLRGADILSLPEFIP